MSDVQVQAPPVVAVVVTKDPGPWLEQTLAALGAQDYPALSVLVLDAGSQEDPTARVAAVLPDAFVRRLPVDGGYAASANHVLQMVQGAPLYLFCHDDVAPDPDAVHLMVEEAYRSNAAVVTPKQVGWVDPDRLLHVGMAVDKGGAVVDRVLPLELDHGQHDSARDVFVAPGGCTLVRADLFTELGGFDPLIRAMGEDLDLCWRAQIAGARVVVAPAARIRHLELVAGGLRQAPVDEPGRSLRDLQRRHELYVVLKVYGAGQLLRILPQLVVLSVAEVVVALVTGHRARARAVAGAWAWNLRHRAEVRAGRRAVAATRRVPDRDLRRLQLRGSARLTSYVRRAATYGLHQAHLDSEALEADGRAAGPPAGGGGQAQPGGAAEVPADITGPSGAGGAPHPNGDGGPAGVVGAGRPADTLQAVDEGAAGAAAQPAAGPAGRAASALSSRLLGVVSLAKGDVPDLRGPAGAGGRARSAAEVNRSVRLRALLWAVVAVVGLYGSRSLLSSGFPLLGQLLPVPSWGALWHQLVTAWHPAAGIGGVTPASPGLGELGVLATVFGGAVGLVQTVVVLGCVPLGALGVARLARPCGSVRGRTVATLLYLALPLPYDDLATGRWQALVVYAAVPWVLGVLARSARLEPFAPRPPAGADGEAALVRPWRHSPVGHALALGLLEAGFAALAPQLLAVSLVVAAGLAVGTLAVGGWGSARAAGRVAAVAVGAAAVALVLLMPWSVGMLAGAEPWRALFGPTPVAAGGVGVGELLRFAVGPVGHTPLAYAYAVAGFLPLVIAGRWRLSWATRLWALALVAWVLAWATGRGWLGPVSLPVGALLAPAGAAMALGAGLGFAALESDLPRYRFGWRQAASVVGGVAALVGLLPALAAAGTGRWDLPSQGWRTATSFMAARNHPGQFRVLWLGDPALLPGPSWSVGPGLSATVTEGSTPDLATTLTPVAPGPLATVAAAVRQVQQGDTVQLGAVLGPAAIHYVVVASSLAPTVLGYRSPVRSTAPAGLTAALERQIDLRQLSTEAGYEIFADPGAMPERAVSSGGPWHAALDGAAGGDAYTGTVPAGTLRVSVAPAGAWHVTGPGGRPLPAAAEVAGAPAFRVEAAGRVTAGYRGSWAHGLLLVLELLLVLGAAGALVGRRRSVDWWWRPLRRRWASEGGRHPAGAHAGGAPRTARRRPATGGAAVAVPEGDDHAGVAP